MERLKLLRQKKNVLQKDVAEAINVSRTTYVKYENGDSEPSHKILIKLAEYYNVSIDYLLNKTNSRSYNKGIKIPVLGSVAAGIPISAIQDIIDEEEISEELASTGEFFGLVIKGDSMSPIITNGDTVIVRSQPDTENGEIAIVLVNGDEATCKKIKKTPEGVMLIPLNPDYEPTFYSNKQIEQLPVRIIGKVVEQRRKF